MNFSPESHAGVFSASMVVFLRSGNIRDKKTPSDKRLFRRLPEGVLFSATDTGDIVVPACSYETTPASAAASAGADSLI